MIVDMDYDLLMPCFDIYNLLEDNTIAFIDVSVHFCFQLFVIILKIDERHLLELNSFTSSGWRFNFLYSSIITQIWSILNPCSLSLYNLNQYIAYREHKLSLTPFVPLEGIAMLLRSTKQKQSLLPKSLGKASKRGFITRRTHMVDSKFFYLEALRLSEPCRRPGAPRKGSNSRARKGSRRLDGTLDAPPVSPVVPVIYTVYSCCLYTDFARLG